MAEFSGLWTTDASTPVGHQQASYTQAQLSTMLDIAAACGKYEGVAPSYLNELVPSDGGANTLNVASGGAIVDGKFYNNDSTNGVNIPSASAGTTRFDRVVVRADWGNFQVTLVRIEGDAVGPPSVTKTPGTTYDIQIAQVEVDDAGNLLVVTDEREWAAPEVDDATLEVHQDTGRLQVKDGGLAESKLAAAVAAQLVTNGDSHDHSGGDGAQLPTGAYQNESVTPAKIANRTRHRFLSAGQAAAAINANIGAAGAPEPITPSILYSDGADEVGVFNTIVPADWSSGTITIKVYWSTITGTGDFYFDFRAYAKAAGEVVLDSSLTGIDVTETDSIGTAQELEVHTVGSTLSVSAGEHLAFYIERRATEANDTIGSIVYVLGIELEYTADS